jgi:hypothetical protein
MSSLPQDGYSAHVSLKLHVSGEVIDVAKVGPERIVLKEPRHISSGEAQLEITIGGTRKEQHVVLAPQDLRSLGEIRYW